MVCAVALSLIIAFIILMGNKTGIRYKIRDYCDIWHLSFMAKMLDCDFCLCFWLSVLNTFLILVIFKEPMLLLLPFLSTPLARFWL